MAKVHVFLAEALRRRGLKVSGKPVACPEWLSPAARLEWNRVMPELVECGLMDSIDAAMLAVYCSMVAAVGECIEAIQKDGEQITHWDDDGTARLVPHPGISESEECAKRAAALAGDFGLPARSDGRMILPSEMEAGRNG